METKFSEDQGSLLEAIENGTRTDVLSLIDGRQVLVHRGQIITEAKPRTRPELASIQVETLTALAAILTREQVKIQDSVVRVASPHFVEVVDISEPEKHQKIIQACAKLPTIGVLAGYVPLDQALIELRQFFEQTPMTDSITEQLSKVKVEDITEIEDDGMGVDVTVRSRVQGKNKDATAFNLELTPFRTFPELFTVDKEVSGEIGDLVVSGTFTMRWKKDDKNVRVFLAEQGNLKWRYAQMQKIAEYLRTLLPEAVILV